MKEKRKRLQKRGKAKRRAILSAVILAALFLLALLFLILTGPHGEAGEEGTEVTFDDKDRLFDEETKVEVLIGDSVTEMTLSDYLAGVLGGEMPALYPKEALKAQAIAARTNVIYKKRLREETPASASHKEADVCAKSSHCQAYASEEQLREKWGGSYEEYMALIREAGRQYAGSGTVSEDLLTRIGSPMIPEEEYARIVNGTA